MADRTPGGGQRRARTEPGPREPTTGPRLSVVRTPPGLNAAIDIACAIVLALRPDQLDLANPLGQRLARARVERKLRGSQQALRGCLHSVPVPEWDDRWLWACATAQSLYPENPAVAHIPSHTRSLTTYV